MSHPIKDNVASNKRQLCIQFASNKIQVEKQIKCNLAFPNKNPNKKII